MASPQTIIGQPDPQEVVAQIAKTAEDLRVDDFRVRVQRRRAGNALPEQILTLDGAKAEHFSAPETWLPRIAGGGLFMLTAFHCSNNSAPVGGPFPVQVEGPMRDPDVSVVDALDWTGPRVCVFPMPKAVRRVASDVTPLPGGHDASPRTTAPEPSGAGGFLQAQLAEVQRQKDALGEERQKLEIDRIRRENQLALERAERRAEEAAMRIPPPAHESSLEKMLAGFLPLALEWFKSERETRSVQQAEQARMQLEMAKMQSETQLAIARTQAEAQARAAEQQAKAAEAQAALQAQIAAKAEESNKFLLQTVLSRPQDEAAGKTAELVSTMVGTTMNMMNTMVELGLTGNRSEPEEPTTLKIVREIARAVALVTTNAAARSMPPAMQPAFGQMPPGQEAQEEPEQGAPSSAPSAVAEPTLYDKLIVAIRDTAVPSKQIAQTILQSLGDPSLIAAYSQSNGGLADLFSKDLGSWMDVPANKDRLQNILKETVTQGVASGVFPAEVGQEIEKMLSK